MNVFNVYVYKMDDMWIGDKLPTIYEVAQTIFHYSNAIKSEKRNETVAAYAKAVRNLWIRSFTEHFVVTLATVKRKVTNIMKDYENRVRCSHQKSSIRVRNRLWMEMDVPQPKRGPRVHADNSSLFDLGRNTKDLIGKEKIFYDDQCGERRHLLSQEIDTGYEEQQLALQEDQRREEEQLQEEIEFVNQDLELILAPVSARCAPTDEAVTVDKECQVDINASPAIREVRNATVGIKDAIATVSTKAGISVQKARVATQKVCEKLYGHHYKLKIPKQSSDQPPQPKKPRSSEDYKVYENVLPSAKSINKFKHKKALRQEIVAAKALVSKKHSTKVALHFDTTQRSRIDGDWPSLILNFRDDNLSECRMISLRPIFLRMKIGRR